MAQCEIASISLKPCLQAPRISRLSAGDEVCNYSWPGASGCLHNHEQRAQRHVSVCSPLAATETMSSQPQRWQSGVRARCLRRSGFGINRTGVSPLDLKEVLAEETERAWLFRRL